MKIIAGIPAHNNWRGIASLIYGAEEHVDEIIVVGDGSEDKTVKIIERTRTGATIIKQGDAGEGVAVRRLIKEAKKRDADVLVLIEANCEYNPGDIPKVLAPIVNDEADLVLGSRFIGDEKEENKNKMVFARRFWIKMFSLMANRVVNAKVTVTDSQSGLRALSRYAIDAIRTEMNGDAMKWEMVANAADQGLRIREVGIGIGGDGRISGGYD